MASKKIVVLARSLSSLSRCGLFKRNPSLSSLLNSSKEIPGTLPVLRSFSTGSWLDRSKDILSILQQKIIPNTHGIGAVRLASIVLDRSFNAAADLPPFQEIEMPSLSPTMTQGNIAKWRKSVGDSVNAGDVLCEIETDKATLEMESMEDGFVAKILYDEGAKDLIVGTPIAILVENEEDIPRFSNYTASAAKEEAPPPPPPSPSPSPSLPPPPKAEPTKVDSEKTPPPSSLTGADSRVFASPAARKFAEDNKVDINQLTGTGPDGRILKADVEELLEQGVAVAEKKVSAYTLPVSMADSYIDIPTTQIRKVIASRLLQSKQTIPHYYLSIDVKIDKLNSVRSEFNALQEKNKGSKISLNDFVIKAAALACKKVPECNSSWVNDYIRQFYNVDVNVAVQTDAGLMVPFVKNADLQGLSNISSEVKRLALAARENKLKPEEFQGGTFSVSNLGMFGIKSFCAVINPPQSAILAVGTSETRVVPGKTSGEFECANFMNVTLSLDHRVVDGAVGAKWLNVFKGYMEDPITMLL